MLSSLWILPGHKVAGELTPPGDKSITHRALIFAGLAKGKSRISTPLSSGDTRATAGILRQLGVTIDERDAAGWTVDSPGLHGFTAPQGELDAGNSGTTCRLMLGILAAQKFSSRIVGDESLSRRPMERVLLPLQRMGARFTSQSGHRLPIEISPVSDAGLTAIRYISPVASAQVKSALLLAGLYAQGTTRIEEPGLSRDHTERMLSAMTALRFGEEPQDVRTKRKLFFAEVDSVAAEMAPLNFAVPGDFSSAAFFIVAALLHPDSRLSVHGVGTNPTRLGLWECLKEMKADVEVGEERLQQGEPVGRIQVTGKNNAALRAVNVHGERVVRTLDELPIWGVAAARANGTSVLSDAAELRVKESDRLATLAENLKRLGVRVETTTDGLVIQGSAQRGFVHPAQSGYGPGYLESFGDHRLAMSMAVASLGVSPGDQPIEVRDTACIATSFPDFEREFQRLTGALVKKEDNA